MDRLDLVSSLAGFVSQPASRPSMASSLCGASFCNNFGASSQLLDWSHKHKHTHMDLDLGAEMSV